MQVEEEKGEEVEKHWWRWRRISRGGSGEAIEVDNKVKSNSRRRRSGGGMMEKEQASWRWMRRSDEGEGGVMA